MKEKKILKWRNKFSGEEGYVKTVSKTRGYFINVYEREEAKKYTNQKQMENDLSILEAIGETENNIFMEEIL